MIVVEVVEIVGSAVEIVEEIVVEVVEIVKEIVEVVFDPAVEILCSAEEVTVTEPALEEVTEIELGQGKIVVVEIDTDKVDGHVLVVVDKADDVDTNDEVTGVTNVVSTT